MPYVVNLRRSSGQSEGMLALCAVKAATKTYPINLQAALKRRQSRRFGVRLRLYFIQYGKRRFVLHNTIQRGPAILDFQG